MSKDNFKTVEQTESINIAEYQKEHPKYFFWARLDKNRPGYGWIVLRGTMERISYDHHEIDDIIDECEFFRPLIRRFPKKPYDNSTQQ